MARPHTRETLRAELERRGCRPHPQGIVVPLGEVWISPAGSYIAIPRPGADGTYPDGVVQDFLEYHGLPEPKASS